MFAINHAATALVIKKYYDDVPLVWLLVSVQLVEMLWVVLNYAGIEKTVTEPAVQSVKDIHLSYMPYSHSLMSTVVISLLAWWIIRRFLGQPRLAAAVAIGIASHIVLDLLTHTRDIQLAPFVPAPKFGLGFYDVPLAGFFLETAYGLLCWRLFGGGKKLLATILVFNLANLSFFSAAVPGPEALMANHPLWIVTAVALQIPVTLILVGVFSTRNAESKMAHI